MKTQILTTEGSKAKEIEMPKFFTGKIREDIVAKVLEAKKTVQPYGPSPVAGKQHSASGRVIHQRHVWKSGYGRGMSRVPRKITSRRGSRFIWEGAEVASTKGGRRAHPPKPISMVNTSKINKKEMVVALNSSLSATANKKEVARKYSTIQESDIKQLPFLVEGKIISLKTKELVKSLEKILGKNLFSVAVREKKLRSGKGKLRGRKYKTNHGALLVVGEKENIKTSVVEVKKAKNVGVEDLAKGGMGRLVIYTEEAIKDLENKFNPKPKEKKE